MGDVTDETKRNRNRKTEPGIAKPAGRMEADDLFADDTSDIDVPVYRKDSTAGAVAGESAANRPRRDIYDVLGRARPQRISPQRPEPAKSAPEKNDTAALDLGKEEKPGRGEKATGAQSVDSKRVDSQPSDTARVGGAAAAGGAVREEAAPVGHKDTANRAEAPTEKFDKSGDQSSRGSADEVPVEAAPRGAKPSKLAASAGEQPTTVIPATKGAKDVAVDRDLAREESKQLPGDRAVIDGEEAEARPADAEAVDRETDVEARAHDKRGTTGFGLFLLRLVAGALLLIYGLQTLFAFGGNPGLNTFEGLLNQYKFADLLAVGLSIGQVVAGGLLILGLLTPVGAAVGAIVSAFLAGHYMGASGGNLWPYALSPQTQLWGLLALICMALIFTGPGRISLDRNRGWARRPLASAWVFAIIAIAGAAAVWLVVGGGNPIH